jgi:hypothetical protein
MARDTRVDQRRSSFASSSSEPSVRSATSETSIRSTLSLSASSASACWFEPQIFEHAVDDVMCAICLMVCNEAVETTCGHLYCSTCLHVAVRTTPRCPTCLQSLRTSPPTNDWHIAVRTRRNIDNLRVRCITTTTSANANVANNGGGGSGGGGGAFPCMWRGDRSKGHQHVTHECAFATATCVRCELVVPRNALETHQGSETCKPECRRCGGRFQNIGKHASKCPARLVPCPNDCKTVDMIPLSTLNEHYARVCPRQTITCDYSGMGCRHQCLRIPRARLIIQRTKNLGLLAYLILMKYPTKGFFRLYQT